MFPSDIANQATEVAQGAYRFAKPTVCSGAPECRSGKGRPTTTGREMRRSFARIATYIEANPLKAGLVEQAEDYAWSGGNPRWRERLDRQAFTKCERGTQRACATVLTKPLMY